MLYRIGRPMKHPESSLLQFVERIPTDVLSGARGRTLAIPVGNRTVSRTITDKAQVVKASLGTRDPSEAKIRQAQVAGAVANRKLDRNPAEGVTIKLGRRLRKRDPSFTQSERRALLSAALHYRKGPAEHPKTAAAKRWVPWLCTYSGARVGEIAQLRKEDVRNVDGYWVMVITPEAGTVKTKEARFVPIHEHLVEQGFLAFVEASKPGPLFLEVKDGQSLAGKHQALKNRLHEFARKAVPDPDVQPNHGWRHTFKTIGLEAGIEGRVLDVLLGHAPRTEGEGYGGVSIKARAQAMQRFPRFDV